jgi:LemA protein
MKKGLFIAGGCLGALVVVGAIIAMSFIGRYNGYVTESKKVDGQWAQVENQLKRRFDLIPNLNKVADKFTKQERAIYDKIIEGRKAYSNAKDVDGKVQAASQFSSDLSRLMVVVEQNPELKSDGILRDFMVSLEGTENRIAVERMRYNEMVTIYNTMIAKFPDKFIAGMFGFKEKPLYKISETEAENIQVDFDEEK